MNDLVIYSIPSKVNELENATIRVDQKILWFYVSVTNAQRMDVSQRSEQLVHIEPDHEGRYRLLWLRVVSRQTVDRLRNELEHQI